VLVFTCLLALSEAEAQNAGPPQPADKSHPRTVSDHQFDIEAAAIRAVNRARQQAAAAATPADTERMVGEANAAIRKAVTDQGLSVEEFKAIVAMADSDPTLRARLLARLGPTDK
jgi:hypothetical protein